MADLKCAVLVASDRVAAGEMEDRSGAEAAAALGACAEVTDTVGVPDQRDKISAQLEKWCDAGIDVIVTVGGTGFQLGIVNFAESMKGLQIGVFNFNNKGLLPFLPFFNWSN